MGRMGLDTQDESLRKLADAERQVMSRPVTPAEMKGFAKARRRPPTKWPFLRIGTPSQIDGPEGYSIEIGVKGTF